MLTLSLFILLIYSSVINNSVNLMTNNRNVIKIGLLIIIYSLYIMIDTSLIDTNILLSDIYIYNDLYILNIFNIYIIILIYIVIISLLTINIIQMSSYNNEGIINFNNLSNLNNFNRYYISIIIFNILGIILFITSNNIISIFIGIELQSYSLYILTGMPSKSQISSHNSLFYYLIGGFGSIIILYGLSLLYYISGNIYLNNINIFLDYLLFRDNLLIGWILIIFGLLIKIGAGPMYSWSVLLYMNSNTIITSYISIIPKISILSYIWYIYHNLNISLLDNNNISLYNMNYKIIFILSLIISLSLLLGSIIGLTQIKIKSILAYSGLLNIGYLLLAILVNNTTPSAIVGYIIYISQYSLSHVSIFLLLIIACLYNTNKNNYTNHLTYIYELACIKNNIYLVISLCIIIGSFIGIPPLFGFYGKYYLLIGSINNNYIWLSILLIISSIIATIYYLYFLNIVIIRNNSSILNNNNNNNIIPIIGNSLSYIFSSFIMIILFNFIQSYNILKGAYIIAINLI